MAFKKTLKWEDVIARNSSEGYTCNLRDTFTWK